MFLLGAFCFTLLTFQVVHQGPLTRFDQPLARSIHEWATGQGILLVLFMRFFSAFGRDGLVLIVAILFVFWIRRNFERELGWLIVGVLGGELLFQVASNLIGRTRPEFKDPFETLIGPGFPSGHATTNLLLAWLVLAFLLPRMRSPLRKALLIGATVFFVLARSFSRLFLGLHYITDILGGFALGLGWGGLVYTLIDLYFFRGPGRAKRSRNTPG
jgi:undecaprenyl-diphosphatase